jgi:hypothetical protein
MLLKQLTLIQKMMKDLNTLKFKHFVLVFISFIQGVNIFCWPSNAWAWDSASNNPTHPTHSYLTEWAIVQLQGQSLELQHFQDVMLEGANTELHELPVSATKYGIDLEAKRIQHQGTNEGCNDIQGWWQDSLTAYRQGQKQQAYFFLGIMLHMIEDMGVPAHANKVYHQGNLTEFDNFELLSLANWKPKFDDINRTDPNYAQPWQYYAFSQEWTHADAPDYQNRSSFAKFWLTASAAEKRLLSNRQGRTCHLTGWALKSAIQAFMQA